MMIVRLLYRLFLQHLDERRRTRRLSEANSEFALPNQQLVMDQANNHRKLKLWFSVLVVLAGTIALGWQFLNLPSKTMLSAGKAELQLQIDSSDTWPLVVYLQGEDLPLPESSSTHPVVSQIESVNGNFAPAFQVMPAAGTLIVTNNDNTAHNTHIFNRGDTIFNVALPIPGKSVRKTLTGFGVFNVRCDLHPRMQASLFVPPSRYYAVLDKPNSISFDNIPSGQYVLHLWQANRPEHTRLIELAGGESKTLRLRIK